MGIHGKSTQFTFLEVNLILEVPDSFNPDDASDECHQAQNEDEGFDDEFNRRLQRNRNRDFDDDDDDDEDYWDENQWDED